MAGKKTGRLVLDDAGMRQVLDSLAPTLQARAEKVAASVGADTDVRMGTSATGRPVALVAITQPNGLLLQVRDGVLTRAAARQGMDIHRYPIED